MKPATSTKVVEQCQGCGGDIVSGEWILVAGDRAYHRKYKCLYLGKVLNELVKEMYVEEWLYGD